MILQRAGARRRLSLTLAELRGWQLLVAGAGYWGNVVRTAPVAGEAGVGFVVDAVVQNGAFCAAAWVLVGARARGWAASGPASLGQIATALALGLLCAAPSRQATILALAALGVQLARSAGGRADRPTAALLLALAADMAWTSAYAMPLHDAAASLDARAVAGLLALAGDAMAVQSNIVADPAGGSGIEILVRCASSYPLAGVGLAYLVASVHQRRLPGLRDAPWIAGSLLASVVLTELRLCWMASRESDFLWLHEGGGVTAYTLAAVALAVAFPLLAARAACAARPS